jgi:hypothetical protein
MQATTYTHNEKQARLVDCALQVHDAQVEVQWTYHHCLGGMPGQGGRAHEDGRPLQRIGWTQVLV